MSLDLLVFGAALLSTGLAVSACSTPSQRVDDEARRLGLARRVVPGTTFSHVVYFRPSPPTSGQRAAPLHVYLEGDGSPRRAVRGAMGSAPPDPTPLPVALRLMALDPAPGLYLGRPCYHGTSCHWRYWTVARFASEVVESLAAALATSRGQWGNQSVVLIGYSGGGALAMLLAEKVPGVRAVVTVAGNLDTAAWTQHHGFSPLSQSLDPALRPPLTPDVLQLHLLAGRDRRVPPRLVRAAIARQPAARSRLFPGFDHACCWASAWPWALEELERELAAR